MPTLDANLLSFELLTFSNLFTKKSVKRFLPYDYGTELARIFRPFIYADIQLNNDASSLEQGAFAAYPFVTIQTGLKHNSSD